jgi:hypothetical protein
MVKLLLTALMIWLACCSGVAAAELPVLRI